MNLLELRTELLARGFDALSATRCNQFINAAVQELDGAYPWPYLESSGTGTAPVTIPDIRELEAVTNEDTNVPLEVVQWRNIVDWYGDLATTGSPIYAYVAWPSGIPVVATYPTSTATIGVQYWVASPIMVGDNDEPLMPERFHNVILAVASRMASAESEGNTGSWQVEADRGLQMMMLQLLPDQVDGQVQRISFDSVDW